MTDSFASDFSKRDKIAFTESKSLANKKGKVFGSWIQKHINNNTASGCCKFSLAKFGNLGAIKSLLTTPTYGVQSNCGPRIWKSSFKLLIPLSLIFLAILSETGSSPSTPQSTLFWAHKSEYMRGSMVVAKTVA